MIRFLSGPACPDANGLCLKRAPYFLRVVAKQRTPRCKINWDALDLTTDTPDANETIYVYRLVKNLGSVHIRRQRGGGFYVSAEYEFYPEQPADDIMRDAEKWAEWADAEHKKIFPSKEE